MTQTYHSEREQNATRANAANMSSQGIQRKAVEARLKSEPVQQQSLPEEEMPAQMAAMEEELPAQLASMEDELPAQMAAIEEELLVQAKPAVQLKANETGMPDQLKSGVENLSGMDMSDVKVHYNSSQPAQLNAHAYAQGTDIHVAPGQEQHLPHEAWHVVQQKQGRVQATTQLKESVPVNDDPSLETEADVMGQKSLQQG
ncbi:DUF4157 domain-containing protein [Chitinophaga pinensis]|uniref:DUF4157 domain-containing protein n=1 Tax=Chitinophaga pinensis TaxID=79329 RepID=A0A5C6LKU9_9BACT|nr:DUF4157 domain-containing protein [Chitinophaga pinensis]TWV95171.1 DUF4157 domain-containing protein [Chitinophaga pinensis]